MQVRVTARHFDLTDNLNSYAQDEIKRLLEKDNGYVKLWRWFNTDEKITKWRVWPCSKKNGFEDPIEGHIG